MKDLLKLYKIILINFMILSCNKANYSKKKMNKATELAMHLNKEKSLSEKESSSENEAQELKETEITTSKCIQDDLEGNQYNDLTHFDFDFKTVSPKKNQDSYECYKIICKNQKKLNKTLKKMLRAIESSPSIKYYELPIWQELPSKHQNKITRRLYYKKLKEETACLEISKISMRRFISITTGLLLLSLEGLFIYMDQRESNYYIQGCKNSEKCDNYTNYNDCFEDNNECIKLKTDYFWSLIYNLYPLVYLLIIFPLLLWIFDPYYIETKDMMTKFCFIVCKNNPDINCFKFSEPKHHKNKTYDLVCCRKPDPERKGWGSCICGLCKYPFWYRMKYDFLNCQSIISIWNSVCCFLSGNKKNDYSDF
ncbi:MAG: hypothetical protein GY830_08620 [Bacteroidetes bacterium]|nr:hypothetical protein [Bacteroidota bacterium]